MKLRKYMGNRTTIVDAMNANYIDDIIKIFNKNSRVRIKIVGVKTVNEVISEDFTDLRAKIKVKKLDEATKQILVDLVGTSKTGGLTIDSLDQLLLNSYSVTDTDYNVIDLAIMLDPNSYFKEDKVASVTDTNIDCLKYLESQGYTLFVDKETRARIDDVSYVYEPDEVDGSIFRRKMFMPTKVKQVMKINGNYKILPLQKYRKFSHLNGIVTVKKPVTDVGGGILSYYSVSNTDNIYNIEFMKISTNVMCVLDRYKDEPIVADLLGDGTLTESYLDYIENKDKDQYSKQILSYLDQIPYTDLIEAILILIGRGSKLSMYRFDTNFTIVTELLRKIYSAVGKIENKNTGTTRNYKMANADKINLKANTLVNIFKAAENGLTESLSNTNSLTLAASLKYKDLSTKEKTFLMECNSIEDPNCVVVNANSMGHSVSVPLFLDIALIE